ncbi:MAG: CoA-binding protein [Myxococcales bacterium]|nr:CoA-binding protein [Myxococcales bacterium]
MNGGPSVAERIEAFLAGDGFAVVGATTVRAKYGNKVLRSYLQAGRTAYPVHPREREIEGLRAYPNLGAIPGAVHGVSIITPPAITERVVEEAAALGVRHLWMQPGAESTKAIERAEARGVAVIAGGPCVLVELGFRG